MERKKKRLFEWTLVSCTLIVAIWASVVADLSPKWEHALVYTILVFVGSTMALRPAWSLPFFWPGLGALLVVHVIAISVITLALPLDSRGIRGIPLIAMSMGEFLLIANILWRITHQNHSLSSSKFNP